MGSKNEEEKTDNEELTDKEESTNTKESTDLSEISWLECDEKVKDVKELKFLTPNKLLQNSANYYFQYC